jgi:hypothetical protein
VSPGKKLRLGTGALVAQSSEPAIAPPISKPEQLARGVEVWIYYRTWRRGVISRIVEVNSKLAQRGPYRGNRAIVMVNEGRTAVRRLCRELLPCSLVPEAPAMPSGILDRESACQLAGEWWAAREIACP